MKPIEDIDRKKRLLVLDDESVMREMVADIAMSCGFDVSTAGDASALHETSFREFDVVVLDLVMPHLDGIEVLRTLAKVNCLAKLVLMSGMDRRILDAARKIAEEQGLEVAAVLLKPFRPSQLKQALDHNINLASFRKPRGDSQLQVTMEDLGRAIEGDELVLHYQPKVRLPGMQWCGIEALARWQHPQLGLLYPDKFITLAEHPDHALAFTYKVMDQALAACRHLSETVGCTGTVSINLPPAALTDLQFPESAAALIDASGLDRSRVLLEITETSIPASLAVALDIQTRLHMRNIRLSIDDFGTGHSSMERLQDSPFAELKIDMVFVRNMQTNASSRAIVENAIELGHRLNMAVVAEGVEDAATLARLAAMGCDLVQGYFLGKPLPSDKLELWAAEHDKLNCADPHGR